MSVASIVYRTDANTLVLCPFCSALHKHGADIKEGDCRGSDCMRGDYKIGKNLDWKIVGSTLRRRDLELARRRELRNEKTKEYFKSRGVEVDVSKKSINIDV